MKKIVVQNEGVTDIDYVLYIPDKMRRNSKILLSLNPEDALDELESNARISTILENATMPVMIPIIKKWLDNEGNIIEMPNISGLSKKEATEKVDEYKIELSEYTEMYPYTLLNSKINTPKIFEKYIEVIKDAYSRLWKANILDKTDDFSVDIEGYSAQGVKAQRLAMLIPEYVRSVFVGGAISSIPIVSENEDLPYPIGFSNISEIVGEEKAKTIVSNYKKVFQNLFVSENELEFDGRFTINGIPVSQHDKSPDVVEIVDKQVELFGEDINDRVNSVINLNRENGANIQNYKIYKNTNHHSPNKDIVRDMVRVIEGLDEGEKIILEGGADRINTEFQEKRKAKFLEKRKVDIETLVRNIPRDSLNQSDINGAENNLKNRERKNSVKDKI